MVRNTRRAILVALLLGLGLLTGSAWAGAPAHPATHHVAPLVGDNVPPPVGI